MLNAIYAIALKTVKNLKIWYNINVKNNWTINKTSEIYEKIIDQKYKNNGN